MNIVTDLTHLIYASSATRTMHDQDLIAILEKSHLHNKEVGVTGMLLYRGGNFCKCLKGRNKRLMRVLKLSSKTPAIIK